MKKVRNYYKRNLKSLVIREVDNLVELMTEIDEKGQSIIDRLPQNPDKIPDWINDTGLGNMTKKQCKCKNKIGEV